MKLIILLSAFVVAVMGQSELETALKTGNDQFTSKMFQEVAKIEKGKSYVLSAFSVLSPLAQLALASVNLPHDETLSAIGFSNDNVTKEVFSDLNKRLKGVKGVELKQANKVYIRNGYSLNNNFAAISKSVFDSEVQNINFEESNQAANEINRWVEDHTNKRIKDLVNPSSIDGTTVAILVNAIYFKGKWKYPFVKERTQDRDFYVSKDKIIKVPMMMQTKSFNYAESQELNAKLLEMPYEGEETSLVIALPNEIDGIDNLIQKISDPAVLNNALKKMYEAEVYVSLPKFKIETKTDLKEVLMKMNVKALFSPSKDNLSNFLKEASDLYVSDAVQKAFIEVNEEGSEAAAANEFVITIRSGRVYLHRSFVADRPFYYALKCRNVILFSGIYYS